MRRVASDEVDTVDPAALDRFRLELIAAGFEPLTPGDVRGWTGPIHPRLGELSGTDTMVVLIRDGFPFRWPKVLVKGGTIVSDHVSAGGEVCLFQPDDASGQWMTFAGLNARIDAWCDRQQTGFGDEDALLDAHLYFNVHHLAMATLDLGALRGTSDGGSGSTGELHGVRKSDRERVLELKPSRSSTSGALPGRWYRHENPLVAPPRDLAAFRDALTTGQRNNFDRRLKNVRETGTSLLSVLIWGAPHGDNGLVLLLSRTDDGDVAAKALELAPTDERVLLLRAGPDQAMLADKHVVMFGVGSIGSNVACRLAEAGLRKMRLVDNDELRPGNMVRHAATFGVGSEKVIVMKVEIVGSAPWCEVEPVEEAPWGATRIRELLRDVDLVIDATGLAAFTGLIANICAANETPLVSAALYRGGSVARVRRQLPGTDTPIGARSNSAEYPVIPPGEEPVSLEAGCNAVVNNASPVAVASVAALTAEVVVDALANADRYSEETIDVYRPLDDPPLDAVGRVR